MLAAPMTSYQKGGALGANTVRRRLSPFRNRGRHGIDKCLIASRQAGGHENPGGRRRRPCFGANFASVTAKFGLRHGRVSRHWRSRCIPRLTKARWRVKKEEEPLTSGLGSGMVPNSVLTAAPPMTVASPSTISSRIASWFDASLPQSGPRGHQLTVCRRHVFLMRFAPQDRLNDRPR